MTRLFLLLLEILVSLPTLLLPREALSSKISLPAFPSCSLGGLAATWEAGETTTRVHVMFANHSTPFAKKKTFE